MSDETHDERPEATQEEVEWLRRALEAAPAPASMPVPAEDPAERLLALAELAETREPLDDALAEDPEALELLLAGRAAPEPGPPPLRLISRARGLVERDERGRRSGRARQV